MNNLEWLGPWGESLEFGLIMVLALLGVECLILARRSYKKTMAVEDDDAALGAEFGLFSAPNALVDRPETLPPRVQILGASGVFILLLSAGLSLYAFV